MKLNIPKILEHNGEKFMLHSVKEQSRDATRIGRKLQREAKRFRIKHINNKFVVYYR